MKCIIVDDEPLAREGIEINLKEMGYLDLVGSFGTAMKANVFLADNQVDLMFLDIQMPGITGLEFVRSLKVRPLIILTTAYPDFALEGFELDVVDYLLKPVRLDRFAKAVNKAKELFDLYKSSDNQVEQINDEFIYIKSERKYIRVFYKDIRYIKGLKDYVMMYTAEDKIITAMNIKTIYAQLPQKIFARVNKSYLININYIDSVETDFIQLAGKEIPLGATYKEMFLKTHIKGKLISR
jgi:DNA-binding LytR/AlgR family response regulator